MEPSTRRAGAFTLEQLLPATGSLLIAALLIYAFVVRVAYPFDLEWIEGGLLVEAQRFEDGRPLYIEPSAEFIPSVYPPLYPWLISLLGQPSYALGRSISAVATLAAVLAAVLAARRERAPWGLALAAGGLFVSCYDDCGSFFDLVRIDALAVGLAAWSIHLCRGGRFAGVVGSGLLLAAAFATKQSFAVLGLPLLVWLAVYRGWRRAAEFAVSAILPALVLVGVLQWFSDGWYLTYVLDVPRSHPLVARRIWQTAPLELGSALPWILGASLLALLVSGSWRPRRPGIGSGFWGLLVLCVVPWVMVMRGHFGSFTNVLMPGYWVLSIAGIVVLARLLERRPDRRLALAVGLLICWQLWQGRWSAADWLPGDEDRRSHQALVASIGRLEGSVFMPHAPWYPRLVGKTPSFTITALWDLQHPGSPLAKESGVVARALAGKAWDQIVTPLDSPLGNGLGTAYRRVADWPSPAVTPIPTRVGWPVRFGELWRPIAGPRASGSTPVAGGGSPVP